jgi:hypothetical protein
MLPKKAKKIVAIKVLFLTRNASRLSGGMIVRRRPIIRSTARISPAIFFIIPELIFTEFSVFFLSLKIE